MPQRDSRQARISPGLVTLLIVIAAGAMLKLKANRPLEVKVAVIERAQLNTRLTASGFIESIQARVTPQAAARVTAVLVEENQRVRAGQALATLDSKAVVAETEATRAAAVAAAAQSSGAEHAVEAIKQQAPGALGQAQAAVELAREQLKKLEAGARPQEKLAALATAAQALAALETARAQLARSQAAVEQQQAVAESSVKEAEALLESSRASERRVLGGARRQEVAQAEAALREARARADFAQKELERNQKLYAGGGVSRQQLESSQTQLASVREAETAARERVDLLKAGSRKEELDAARAEVVAAAARLQRAKTSQDEVKIRQQEVAAARALVTQAEAALAAASEQAKLVHAGARNEDIAAAKARVREAMAALAQAASWQPQIRVREAERAAAASNAQQASSHARSAEARAQEYTLVAPFDGVVARRFVDPGDSASPATPAFLIVDPERRWVSAEVDAEDLSKLHVGQEVEIGAEAFAGKTFKGRVRHINVVAEPKPGGRTRARIVRCRIELLEAAAELKPGLEVDVRAGANLKSSALLAPNDAVLNEGEKRVALVIEGPAQAAVVRKREVKTGAKTETHTEILSGLNAGDRVVVEGKEGLQDGQRVIAR